MEAVYTLNTLGYIHSTTAHNLESCDSDTNSVQWKISKQHYPYEPDR